MHIMCQSGGGRRVERSALRRWPVNLEDVRRNYDRASGSYDVLAELVFGRVLGIERLRERTLGLLGNLRGATVLDVGCGTGRNLPSLVRGVGPDGRVVGVDASEGMLVRARRRLEAAGWGNVTLVRGDAVTLASVGAGFDALVSVWCYGIVYDLQAALRRAVAVLRPGGRLAIMDFGATRAERGWARGLYPLYAAALRAAHIDTAADLEDGALRARWNAGRAMLGEVLEGWREEPYLGGLGFIGAGRKPSVGGAAGVGGEGVWSAPSVFGSCLVDE